MHNPVIEITKHFKKRFYQRQARTKRVQDFARDAYLYGEDVSDLDYKVYAKKLNHKERAYGTYAKIYHGFVYWFKGNVAITIYPIPQKIHKKI